MPRSRCPLRWACRSLISKLGEICASYCVKGRRVCIEGRLRTREYDGSDGLRRHTTEIVAETMKLLDRPRTEGGPASDDDTATEADASAVVDVGPENGEHRRTTRRTEAVAIS